MPREIHPSPSPSRSPRPASAHTQTYDADTESSIHEDLTPTAPANEHTALLSKQLPSPPASSSFPDNKPDGPSIPSELLLQLRSALPVILAYTLQNSLQTISVLIVGRISPEALATAAFAYMFAMASGWLIALGGTTAVDTLASAAFTCGSDPAELGVILQRSFVVLGLFYVPVMVLWGVSEPLFIALGQEAWLARDASRFLWILAPGGLGYVFFECLKKFLQAQALMRPGTYILLITTPINALLNYLLIHTFHLGLYGAPLATGVSYWLSFLLLWLYMRSAPQRGSGSWAGFSRQTFHLRHLLTFARLAVLGTLHVGTEWWAFEIVALVAGRLGTTPLASQSIIMTTDQILNTIPFGLGVAASSRVANLLGAARPHAAARAAHCAAVLSVALAALLAAVLLATRHDYAKLFNSSSPPVVRLTAEVMPYVAAFQIADGLNGSCGGALRGMGRQHVGAGVNILAYYVVALPVGIWLAWHGWGLGGLWVGQCGALYLVGVGEWGIVAFSDWEGEVARALGRLDRCWIEDGGGRERGEA